MQWLHDPNDFNVYNLNNVRREASKRIRKRNEGISES